MSAGAVTETGTRRGKPDLSPVTLVAVTSISIAATVRALERSMEQADFGAALLLSDQAPTAAHPRIEWRRIRRIASREDYSWFMLHELAAHIETPFALCVQWDGYVLNGAGWSEAFLEYDYIGAPWPQFDDDHRVGNGGFSLRSRKLLQACTKLPVRPGDAEDIAICRMHRRQLEEEAGVRFAPEQVARTFSFERLPSTGAEFGFHGVFNIRSVEGDREFAELLASLDPRTIGRPESRELFRQSMLRGDIRSAYLTLRNRIARAPESTQINDRQD